MPNVIPSIAANAAKLAVLRRELHAHPELCFEERRTADVITRSLTDWGIPVHRGLGGTGLVGMVRGGRSSRAIGLRADMDALPISEGNSFAHASQCPGKMHACGHDGHTAMLLAAAQHLAQHGRFDGIVYLIFQPAEEGGSGAREMMQDGLFERFPMQAIFGMHNWPGLPVGQFALSPGPVMASSNEFRITVRGKGTHAAMPHSGIDPVPVACQIVQAFQTILTRSVRPIDSGVVSVTRVRAGEALNAIAEVCELAGTVRSFTTEVLEVIEKRMREIVLGTCQAFGASGEFEFRNLYPPTVNSEKETGFVHAALADFVGPQNVQRFEPTMGAEDFSFYLQKIPGCFFMIGNGLDSRPLHSATYDFNDDLIAVGGSMWVRLVEAWMAPGSA